MSETLGFDGYTQAGGFVVLHGPVIELRRERSEKVKPGSWPWGGMYAEGDVRASIAWPQREPGKAGRAGCLAVAIMDPTGRMRVIKIIDWEGVTTTIPERNGVPVLGLGAWVARLLGCGVTNFAVQAGDMSHAQGMCGLLTQDAAVLTASRRRMKLDPIRDMDIALAVRQEMQGRIVVPSEYGEEIQRQDAAGIVGPMMFGLACLAYSYRNVKQYRAAPEDERWRGW